MSSPLEKIRYVFLHFDGVVLENILAPITYAIVQKLGGVYSAEIENNVFAKSQKHAAEFLIQHLRLPQTVEEIIELYYAERKIYESQHTIRLNPGIDRLLSVLKSMGFRVVSYGGAPMEYFLKNENSISQYLHDEKYIHTRDIRPGVKEIAFEKYYLKPTEALFIDEEFTVAEAAKANGVPFIGVSTGFPYSFQKSEMEKLGVKYILDSTEEISETILKQVQQDVWDNQLW